MFESQRKLALLIPAHNEELAIQATIQSALLAGMRGQDIFVVDDNSSDATASLAAEILGKDQVLTVERSGKAGAIKKALDHFDITSKYIWVHIADADSLFGREYFKTFRNSLDASKYAAATGYVASLPGGWISKFRVYEYTWGLDVVRRLQSLFGVITVIPGPTSCLRTDIIEQLEFETGSLTEDFDLTLQIHRKNLGRIQFIPKAKTHTQDPQNFHDFYAQISRWYRGYFQGLKRHRIGTKLTKIDIYVSGLAIQTFYYGIVQFGVVPVIALVTHRPYILALSFLYDLVVFFGITLFAAIVARRYDILAAFPLFYILRVANLYAFFKSFFEIIILQKFQNSPPGWSTAGRRYKITGGLAK